MIDELFLVRNLFLFTKTFSCLENNTVYGETKGVWSYDLAVCDSWCICLTLGFTFSRVLKNLFDYSGMFK